MLSSLPVEGFCDQEIVQQHLRLPPGSSPSKKIHWFRENVSKQEWNHLSKLFVPLVDHGVPNPQIEAQIPIPF